MAITKTTEVSSSMIGFPKGSQSKADAIIQVTLKHIWDDPNDASLPIKSFEKKNLSPGADVSAYPQFVQDLAAWLWS
jgi:hypothetical protein